MKREEVKKKQPFIVSGMTEKGGGFSYRIEALNPELAHIEAIKNLQRDHPGKLIKLIGKIHVEHEEKEREEKQQLVLPL